MSDESGRKLRKVGVLWKPREGSKSKGSGSITIGTLRQRFVILANDGKREGSKDPDYLLMSSDEPETDPYAERKAQAAPAPAARPTPPPVPVEEPGWVATDSDVPF